MSTSKTWNIAALDVWSTPDPVYSNQIPCCDSRHKHEACQWNWIKKCVIEALLQKIYIILTLEDFC